MVGDVRVTACGVCCSLQGVNALQPVLQNAARQTDGHIECPIAGADGFLEGSAPAEGVLWHLHRRAIRHPQNYTLIPLRHINDIKLVRHVAKLRGTGG